MCRHLVIALMLAGAGLSCTADCAEGFVDQSGTCVADSRIPAPPVECDPECGDHETCDGSTEPSVCVCIPGYEGDPCELGVIPRDPSFLNDEAWSTANDAAVMPLGRGGQGLAFFSPSAVCNAGAVSQMVEMPELGAADQLVAEVEYRARGVAGLDVGFGRAWKTMLPTVEDEWAVVRVCLGEAAFGGTIEFQLASSEPHPECLGDPTATIEVDRFEVKLAETGECPEPGVVLNGAADVGAGGWFFEETIFVGEGPGEAALAADVGQTDGGARLFRPAGPGLDGLGMATRLSVPIPDAANGPQPPAVRFWWTASATEGSEFAIDLGTAGFDRRLGNLFGDGEAHTSTYCLPPWTHGNVIDLSFELPFVQDPAVDLQLVVDDVEIVEDVRCGYSADLFDPGFDSSPNLWPGAVYFDQGETAGVREDSKIANTGAGFFEFTFTTNRQQPYVEMWLLVPESQGAQGPQLVFFSDVPADPETQVRWFLGRGIDLKGDLETGGDWRRDTVCLPPAWSGRWFRFQVQVGPADETFATIDPPKWVRLDDFELTTSSDCPTN